MTDWGAVNDPEFARHIENDMPEEDSQEWARKAVGDE